MISDSVKKGVSKAPHRSLFKAMGYTDEELSRPLVGVIHAKSEIVPGHIHLDKIAEAVADGIRIAGGTPVLMGTIGVCDGIAMGHSGMNFSLASRELVADTCETMIKAHGFDAVAFVPNCDKIVPGMLMAAARITQALNILQRRSYDARQKQRTELLQILMMCLKLWANTPQAKRTKPMCAIWKTRLVPGCGSCAGMFTANSMNCLTEALGMALSGNGTIPAVNAERIRFAKTSGMQLMKVFEAQLLPRDIMTEKAFENGLRTDMALGCSTNSVLHLPAIANECEIELSLDLVDNISKTTPNLCKLSPAGATKYYRFALFRRRWGCIK